MQSASEPTTTPAVMASWAGLMYRETGWAAHAASTHRQPGEFGGNTSRRVVAAVTIPAPAAHRLHPVHHPGRAIPHPSTTTGRPVNALAPVIGGRRTPRWYHGHPGGNTRDWEEVPSLLHPVSALTGGRSAGR